MFPIKSRLMRHFVRSGRSWWTVLLIAGLAGISGLSGLLYGQSSAAQDRRVGTIPGPARLPMNGNPNFSPSDLSPEQQYWYEKMWMALRSENVYPNPDEMAVSGDQYNIGRTLNNYVSTLMMVFRVTGDLALLDEVDRQMELARSQLRDDDGDGYVNWRWTREPDLELYYNKDTHEMDEMLAHSWIPAAIYAMRLNEAYNPVYKEHADFWMDYLLNDFFPKWEARGGLERSLTHPFSQYTRLYFYMWRLTGEQAYLDEANRRADLLDSMMVEVPTANGIAFTWDHRVKGMGNGPLGCQPSVYAIQTTGMFQELALEGFSRYADDAYMAHYATMLRDLVLKAGIDHLSNDICGDGEESFGKYMISTYPALGMWDPTGRIQALSAEAFEEYESVGAPRQIFIPAYMVMLLAELPPMSLPVTPTPAPDMTLALEPLPRDTARPGDVRTPVLPIDMP